MYKNLEENESGNDSKRRERKKGGRKNRKWKRWSTQT